VLAIFKADRHKALLGPLPVHAQHEVVQIDVGAFQAEYFIDPQAGVQQKNHHRPTSRLDATFWFESDDLGDVRIAYRSNWLWWSGK
jgi:hypothetical protein